MGSNYNMQEIAALQKIGGYDVPLDQWDHYLDHEDLTTDRTKARDLTSPYGSLHFAVGFGEEGDENGDWMTCFDYAELPDGRIVLHAVVNTDSGGYIGDAAYLVVERSEAVSVAIRLVEEALEGVSVNDGEHDAEGWNQTPWYFPCAVASFLGVRPWADLPEDELRKSPGPPEI